MMKSIIGILVLLVASMSHAAFAPYKKKMANGQMVTFVTGGGMTPDAFSRVAANQKPDQAELQNSFPLTPQEKNAISVEDIKKMTQEEIDQLYIRLESGPILPGSYNGTVVQNAEMIKDVKKSVYSKIAGEHPMAGSMVKLMCGDRDPVECLAERIWSGKRIYPQNAEGEFMLRNAIDLAVYGTVQTALAPKEDTAKKFFGNITDAVGLTNIAAPKELFPSNKYIPILHAMIFPAHVYCGQSLLDHRRESIIIDYAWGTDFVPYNTSVDVLTGPGYLDIRDEVRMVKPGLYLGRAYTNKIFLLNFVLSNADKNVGVAANACFDGKSTR